MISGKQTEDIIRLFARLRGVPVAKIVRNAARDFVKGAFGKIPVSSQKGKYPPPTAIHNPKYSNARHVARIANPRGGGKVLYLPFAETYDNGTRVAAKRLRYLRKHQLRSRKGYSKWTWTGFYNLLGMGAAPNRPANAPSSAPEQVEVRRNEDSITLMAPLKFTSTRRSGAKAAIIAAGFAQARRKLRPELIRVFKAAARGQVIR